MRHRLTEPVPAVHPGQRTDRRRGRWAAARDSRQRQPPATGHRVRTIGPVGRIIGAVLGAILSAWFIFTVIGGFSAVFKAFLITGLIAAVVFIVVWLLAGRRRQA